MQYVVYGGVPQEVTADGQTTITTSGGVLPEPGDMLLKGDAVNKTGSLGWIYANIFTEIDNANIDAIEIEQSGSTYIGKITFIDPATTQSNLTTLLHQLLLPQRLRREHCQICIFHRKLEDHQQCGVSIQRSEQSTLHRDRSC